MSPDDSTTETETRLARYRVRRERYRLYRAAVKLLVVIATGAVALARLLEIV